MSPFAPGLRIHDRFTLDRLIGAGGMSEVWRAVDGVLGRPVAVKVMSTQLAADPVFWQGALREARAVARITHPNVTQVHDYGEVAVGPDRYVPYLVMELLEGEDLATRLAGGPLSWRQTAAIAEQIAAGLAAAHRLGIVHRDIKPANVMLTPTGVKILDFGIAEASLRPESQRGIAAGTPAYAAPERLRPGPLTPAADMYALGLLIYEMLTGRKAYPAADWAQAVAIRQAPLAPIGVADVPDELLRLMRSLLALDPARRPTAASAAAALRPLSDSTIAAPFAVGSARPPAPPTMVAPLSADGSSSGRSAPAGGRLLPVVLVSAAILLVIAIGLVAVSLWPSGPGGNRGADASTPSTVASSAPTTPSAEPSPSEPASPQSLLAEAENILAQAKDAGTVDEHAAEDLANRFDDLRDHLDESGGRLRKRVRDVNRRILEFASEGDVDAITAERLTGLLNQIAA
jgi:serine/threonine-protein kinase